MRRSTLLANGVQSADFVGKPIAYEGKFAAGASCRLVVTLHVAPMTVP